MTEDMKKELEHDLIIMKAKFLLTQDFATIKQDVEVLAELGMVLPMLIYCASETIAENEIIDKIISSYPEMNEQEIFLVQILGNKANDRMQKALIRHNRRFKFYGAKQSDSENFLTVLKNSSAVIDSAPSEKIVESFKIMVENPERFSDSSVILGVSNLLRRNVSLPFSAYEALLGVANQPYSKYYHEQIEARKIYFNKNEDSSESI